MAQLDRFREYVALVKRKKELEGELGVVEEEIKKQKEVLFLIFEENPKLKVSVDGMTVYLTRRFAARVKEGIERAKAAGILQAWIPEMVKPDFNLNTLSAFIRERIKEGGKEDFEAEMPAAVAECFEIRDWVEIGSCAS